MRKSDTMLFTMLFIIATVCIATKAVSQVSSNAASQAVEVTDPQAQYNLALEYHNGTNGHPKDIAQAVSWWRKAAESGFAKAQYSLGVAYERGDGGLTKDAAQAVSWYQKSAEQGNADAQDSLGGSYAFGTGGLAKDYTEAVRWWSKAAEQGNADAQHNLGVMYSNGGGGLLKDESKAVYWWQKAAEQGKSESQYNLGRWYENGHGGLSIDSAKALYWYQKAAAQGHKGASWHIRILAAHPQEQFAEELTKRMSGEIMWCAGGRDGQLLAGYATTSYLSPNTSKLIETGSQMYIEAFRKGFRFLGMFDRDQDTKTAQLTAHGAAPASLYNISDENRRYLEQATDILMRVANNVNGASQYRIEQEGQVITVCIPVNVPAACPAGQIRQFMPGQGEICTPR